ncbi:MAG TPA: hypothetical protein VJG90_06430 [Candidatus Nanoarchaeia archaeon]|nr:hypothetical protein [Candidatus Nanoarchaeia archaeon]
MIQGIDTEKESVMLIDPERGVPKKRVVSLKKLVKAIKHHESFSKTAGFWVFRTVD